MADGRFVLDAVCNLFTPEIQDSRPAWSKDFHSQKQKTAGNAPAGVSLDRQVALMDEAGVDAALLIAPKLGRRGLEDSWELDPRLVIDAVDAHPDRFRGLAGINPYDGVKGMRALERLVTEYGFVGAHLYPHWFGMAPDHAMYYPFYAKCAELGVPVQMQVGRCQAYNPDRPMADVGHPGAVDRLACHIPELVIVGIHVGWPWTAEMISVADKHRNVYIGTDAYAPKYLDAELVHYISTWGADKVMFGTDWPVIPFDRAVTETEGLGIPEDALNRLFSGNATRVFGWDAAAVAR
ncbi:amidohydrolase family protein [Euzebya pacifica]|uniref:amidohydrolase family protein n=1 Tax=Euzebya pacifica TaxID=1608957 RepID=UPI0030F61C5C